MVQATSFSKNLNLNYKTKLVYDCMLTFTYLFSTESTAPALDNQEGQIEVLVPRWFYFNFPPWSNFTFASPQMIALCVGILRMFTESELRKTTERFPEALRISLSGRSFNAPEYATAPAPALPEKHQS